MGKHYVNLPNQPASDPKACGPLIATADKLGAKSVGTSEWWVEPGNGNTDLKYLSGMGRCRMLSKYARNEKDKFKNHVILPHVGGDKYTVNCSKKGDRSSPMKVEEMETWRKFFYTLHWMNADCKKLFDKVKDRFDDAFKAAFIELEKLGDVQTPKDEPRTLSEPGKEGLPHLWPRARPPDSHKPFHLRIFVVNDVYELLSIEIGGKGLSGTIFPYTTVRPLSEQAGHPWLESAQVMIEPDFKRKWDISKYVSKTGPNKLQVDFGPYVALVNAAKNQKLTLKIKLRVMKSFCGYSIGNFVVVRIKEPNHTPSEVESTVLQTFTHEIGHGCQQVVKVENLFDAKSGAPKTPGEKNPKWDDSVDGSEGGHCITNAKPKPPVACPIKEYMHASGVLCTMFYRDDPAVDAAGKFCDSCLPRLKRVNLNAMHMRAQGWDTY
jgi:hypothetical protein